MSMSRHSVSSFLEFVFKELCIPEATVHKVLWSAYLRETHRSCIRASLSFLLLCLPPQSKALHN